MYLIKIENHFLALRINPQAPIAQKIADDVVLMKLRIDVSKVKESSFLKSDLTDLPSEFWCVPLENTYFFAE